MRRKDETGLFAGVREAADAALGVDNYATKSAALNLSQHGLGPSAATLVPELFKVLDGNWARAFPDAHRSEQNFRWHKPQCYIGKGNKSAEVTLERALICALVDAGRDDWSNQVPLVSGFDPPRSYKRRAVDLVHCRAASSFEFVELKIKSDTPYYAAVEILVYGLLWLLSRRDPRLNDSEILKASELRLSVLAPADYYRRYSVDKLTKAIDEGLRNLGQQQGVTMGFRFTAFPASFAWPRGATKPHSPSDNDLIAALDGRKTVYKTI